MTTLSNSFLFHPRTLKALAVAPLATVLLLSLRAVTSELHSAQPFADRLSGLLGLAAIIAIFAYASTLFLGLPVLMWFRLKRAESWRAYALGGGVIGLVTGLALSVMGIAEFALPKAEGIWDLVWLFGCGLCSGILFWSIDVRTRRS
jgi:hypothetical protein